MYWNVLVILWLEICIVAKKVLVLMYDLTGYEKATTTSASPTMLPTTTWTPPG